VNTHVAVIGAGPAGIFAAKTLTNAGIKVALINRDIKPGGLAEYGIYHNKYKMKSGLRKQFKKALGDENLHYFGNVVVGEEGDITIAALKQAGFDAILVTVGAQGTKWLGLPGEDLRGVYHAKDLVYHYNKLPPYSQQAFEIGKRVALIGVGNVMVDIAHWSIRDLKVDEVVAVARRGPADVKFTKKELEHVASNLDLKALDTEIERTKPVLKAAGQDPSAAKAFILSALENAEPAISDSTFRFDFLASPQRIVGDETGKVIGLEVEETTLELRDGGGTKSIGLGKTRVIDVDTVVFCIGDRVDQNFGLPLDKWQEFAKHPHPQFPVDETSYEAYNPENDEWVEGIFLAGWAREASSGLVGSARKDGTNGANAARSYLETLGGKSAQTDAVAALQAALDKLGKPVVSKEDWQRLELAETAKAAESNLEEFKFASNEEMLAVMALD